MYKRTILIVDDQLINRKILGKILQDEYEILYAQNGKEAIECLHQHADIVSAVILDIVMPVMDGYQVLQIMGTDERLLNIPVIVSSQKDGEDDEVHALSLGAQDFIAKPYKKNIIRHRLSNIIRLRESSSTINRIQKDQLTGLYNKEYFISKVEDLLKENKDQRYDILFLGIERFKLVNDSYGNKKGNEVLKYVADVLKECSGKGSICGRFGADNFYVFSRHVDYTNEMFQPWIKKVEDCPIDLEVKVHCGIYEIHDASMEIEGMCDRAKMAADMNRGQYEQYFAYYDESLREAVLKEQFILSTMHQALEEEQFQVYYQPKYDLNSEMIAGAEALVRWIHPEKGFMSPGDFIPIFEKNGFVTQLDRFVWERACKDIRSWIDMGLCPVAISVNVSRADIYNPKLLDIIMGLVAKYQIPIRYLHLEITESAYTENPEQIIEVVKKLRDSGFIIEMDDFGSGYSSLNMLAEMPVDVLKLDMRFIQMEAKASSGKGILSFVISLAKWMGLAVVAEGVETAQQIAVLRSMDCNYVQGFYYAKPMPDDKFIELIKSTTVTEMICTSRTATQYVTLKSPANCKAEGGVMLIVDDMEINRASLASSFIDEFVVVEKGNGLEAWEYLEQNYKNVEIVMLDLLMPVMDGFQLLSRIRKDDRTKDIPVIITSQGDYDSEQRALAMQADDYISKPYNIDIIKHRVANVVGNHQLQQIKDGMIEKEELKKKSKKVIRETKTVDEKILEKVESLKENFDVVRLVDPTRTLVYEGDQCDIQSCFSVWGKSARCNDCTSIRAYEDHTRLNKLEYSEDGLFFVISQYVPFGKYGAVMELVSKLDDGYVDNVFDKEMLYLNLDEMNNQLERDDLTGVFNRRHLEICLNRYLKSARKSNNDIGIAMMDIDNFKELNNKYGHLAGDEAIKTVANMLEENIAHSKGDFVARFSGDEFVVVCKNIHQDVFEKRIRAVSELIKHVLNSSGERISLSISAGCVMASERTLADEKELMNVADQRLHLAKQQGKGYIVIKD